MRKECTLELIDDNGNVIPNNITKSPNDVVKLGNDVIEVVRCKDCRYFKKIAERSDSGLCHRDIVASAWKENGYCSKGERREESEVEE